MIHRTRMYRLLLLLVATGAWLGALGQSAERAMPTEPDAFIREFKARIGPNTTVEADLMESRIYNAWNDVYFTPDQKTAVIAQANALLEKGIRFWPDLCGYLNVAVAATQPNARVKLELDPFMQVVDTCMVILNRDRLRNFLEYFGRFALEGEFYRNERYQMRFPVPTGSLYIAEEPDPDYTGDPKYQPTIRFPAFRMERVPELLLVTPQVSSRIYNTQGVIDFSTLRFYGQGGTYTWARVGLPAEEVFCTLQNFVLSVTEPGIEADSVRFNKPNAPGGFIVGKLTDHLHFDANVEELQEPEFRSYYTSVELIDFVPHADYVGGYSLRGIHQVGTSTADTLAAVYIKYETYRAVKLEADAIPLDDSSKISLKRARSTVILGNGESLFHPALDAVYEPSGPELTLIKNPREEWYQQMLSSTYHRYKMHFVTLRWNPTQDSIRFRALIDQEHRPAKLESEDFYLYDRYKIYFSNTLVNGIGILYKYVRERRAKEVAEYRKKYLTPKDEATEPEDTPVPDFTSDDYYSWFDDSPVYSDPYVPPVEEETEEAEPEPAIPDPNYTPANAPIVLDEFFKENKRLEPLRPNLENTFLQMDRAGYIYYDRQKGTVTPRKQLFQWARAAMKDKDYDVVQLVSLNPDGDNARMDWKTGVMRLDGVESFILSDSQKVTIRPQSQFVRVYEDRDLQFGGLIYAGKANFWGKGTAKFEFDYRKFNIFCQQLDSVKFFPERDVNYNPRSNPRLNAALKKLKIEDVVGAIYINHPANKSGIKVDKKYPVFDCYSIAYVYWSDRTTQAGQYDRERLFFALDPFALDSLENFDITGLQFLGEFECDSVVPAFRDTLRPVSDNTYGIEEHFPDGVPVYRGKGVFTHKLQMDSYGLWGQGTIDFLNTTAVADTFVFHFDSCMATLTGFKAPETTVNGVYFPEMVTEGRLKYKWLPYQDRMSIETIDEPITMHNGTVTFTGEVIYTPKGVLGKGLLESGPVSLSGDSINLSTLEIQVINGTFEVADPESPEKVVFLVNNADTELNIETGEVEFQTKEPGRALVKFPQQQYEATLPEGTYNQQTGEIGLTTTYPDKRFNVFRSTDPGQHGLSIPAGRARFNTSRQEILLSSVDSILVADAILYPADSQARVNPDGKLGLFENATLRADTANRAHLLDQCQLAVENRLVYKGAGRYPYKTQGVPDQYLMFESLRSLPDTTSYGDGEIGTEQEFLISDRIYFRGKVQMAAKGRFLGFDGEVRIQSDNPLFADSWFVFKDTSVNPDTVFVPITNPKNRAGRPLMVGLLYSPARRLFYTNFFQTLRVATDVSVAEARGGLTYNREAREFRVGPRAKIEGTSYRGTVVSYDDDLQLVTVRGRFHLENHFLAKPAEGEAPDLIEMAGQWREDLQRRTVNTRMLVRLNMPAVPDDALKEARRIFKQLAFDRPDINYQDALLTESAAEFLDPDTSNADEPNTRKYLEQVAKAVFSEDVRLNRDIGGQVVLTDVQLAYNDSVKGFWCTTPVGWSGAGGESIGKMVNARIEYRLGRPIGTTYKSDTLNVYLYLDDNTWIFFRLVDNQVYTLSSEVSYNARIAEAMEKQKVPEGATQQVLAKLEPDEVTRFIRRFSQYLYLDR